MLCGQPPPRASTTAGRGLQRKSCGGATARPWPEPLQAAGSDRRLRGSTARSIASTTRRHLELPCIGSGYVRSLVLRARRSAAPAALPWQRQSRHKGSIEAHSVRAALATRAPQNHIQPSARPWPGPRQGKHRHRALQAAVK